MPPKTFYFAEKCPYENLCSAKSWKNASVWGWCQEEAANQLKAHLVNSPFHHMTDEEADMEIGCVEFKEDEFTPPPPKRPRSGWSSQGAFNGKGVGRGKGDGMGCGSEGPGFGAPGYTSQADVAMGMLARMQQSQALASGAQQATDGQPAGMSRKVQLQTASIRNVSDNSTCGGTLSQ